MCNAMQEPMLPASPAVIVVRVERGRVVEAYSPEGDYAVVVIDDDCDEVEVMEPLPHAALVRHPAWAEVVRQVSE